MSKGALREPVASGVVRLVNRLSRLSGRGAGTVAGGRVGLRICPDLLERLARDRTVIAISGTNGKTTTTAMVAAGWGGDVAVNTTGANMPAGLVAALTESSSVRAALEVDEAWLPEVIRATRPRFVVLLNLSRDQLDRASEVRQMAERWLRCLNAPENREIVVVANANDPLVVYAASGASDVRWCDVPTVWLLDATSCPRCTRPLVHEDRDWHCACGFAKPVSTTVLDGQTVSVGELRAPMTLSVPGTFNEANAAMALTALVAMDVPLEQALQRVGTLSNVAGRFSRRQWRNQTLQLMLAKNPAGFAAVLSTVTEGNDDVWIAINAQIADGHDPSWLYDVPFEQLRGHRVCCFGERRLDLATRLDYAGVEALVIDDDSAPPAFEGTVALIANYTAFAQWIARSSPC